MWAQVKELLFKKYFGTLPVTPLHNLYPSKPIFTCPKDGWTGGWLSACPYGLPQGSVLGPLLYIIYTSEIDPLLTATSVLGHLYADDIQAYLHCPASNATSAVLAISKTLDVLETWMSSNRL